MLAEYTGERGDPSLAAVLASHDMRRFPAGRPNEMQNIVTR